MPISVVEKIYGTYEDKNILDLNMSLKTNKLNLVRTTETRAVYLRDVDVVVRELKEDGVEMFFYGDKSHIFHYLYPATSFGIKAFNQPMEDLIFLPCIEDKVIDKTKVAVFLMNSYPESTESIENVVEKELIKKGFKKSQKGSVEFLLKIEDQNFK
ncbi:hypothetical protein GCM10007103_09180 [Salinimicrobium marinum]|uniref:Uncharacterized protein n=1 Tax=Salinimicrobium marinum TaxID=680283 RepID=A0A918S8A8_9FLAO|nr:hypothetical protein GCM10007103_09180 [Salinimicrobium marinum]